MPVEQPKLSRYFRQGDSRVLRHEHWRMSQLSENVASEPVQLTFDGFDLTNSRVGERGRLRR